MSPFILRITFQKCTQCPSDRHLDDVVVGSDHLVAHGHNGLQRCLGFGNGRHNINHAVALTCGRNRQTIVEIDGVAQPNIAPRFSRTVSKVNGPIPNVGEQNDDVLKGFGFSAAAIETRLRDADDIVCR